MHTINQNMLGGQPFNGGSGFTPAPEGSTLPLFACGVVPLFGAFWFKRRSSSAKYQAA
jgi:hypothetical protein